MINHLKWIILFVGLLNVFVYTTKAISGHGTNNPLLLYSTSKDIRIVNTTRNSNHKITSTILVRNLTEASAIDYNYELKKVCWADHILESIQCITHNDKTDNNSIQIISNEVLSPVGLACDWFTNKLYWTDSETNRIEVATMEGQYRKVLFWTDIDQPRAISLAPMKGLMFWTDWGEIPKIERAGMNGDPTTRKVIISNNIFWPNGLTIDYENELIYWTDGKLQFIEVMNFDGKNRSVVLDSKFEYPFALTMFKTKLYWTDWKTWSIYFYDRSNNEMKELINHVDSSPMDIHTYDKQRQPYKSHPCEKDNGGCSHLCLLSPNPPGYSCACPIGIKLLTNQTCASGPQELLVLARRTDICLIHLDSPDYTHKVLPLNDVKYSIAVDYDPIDGYIYWSDDEVKKIQKVRLNGTDQQDVVITEIQHPDGIAIDWVSRNLYWTDAGTDHVEVCHLDKKYRKTIISDNLVDPRAIAVAPELGWLFWSDWNEKDPKIERSNLDGSERQLIVTKNLGWPNGITLDTKKLKIYWCDAQKDIIEYSNMDGSGRMVLINDNVLHVFGFSLMGDFLYWTDWQMRTIERAHKDTGGQREIIIDQIANVMGLKAIRLGSVNGWNPCSDNNGNCSQLCFYKHNKMKICACELGYELMKDRKTCMKPKAFLLYTKKTKLGMLSIENENNEMIIPVSGIKHASSIDFDTNTQRIYWSDRKLRTIMRSYLNGSDPERVVDLGLTCPENIAIDWLGLNIYWTDPIANRIEVARLVGSSRRTLLWAGKVYDPHSIVLDPPSGYLYWSEWGTSNSIKKSSMDGTNPKKLISTNGHANDLTLDYERRRLYWIEIETLTIMSSDLNGNDKTIIIKENLQKPIGLTIYNNFLYWSDIKTNEIFKADKLTGLNRERLEQLQDPLTDLMIYYEKPKGINQCAVSNGGCSHLCLALPGNVPEEPTRYTCACPTHYTLVGNECIPPKQFMIYSQKNLTVRLLPNPNECPEAVLPIQGLKGVRAIDFDPVNNFLYWIEGKTQIDGKTQNIKRAESTGTQLSIVIHGNSEVQPYDLAVDTLGRLLFWTCAIQNVINVTRLDDNIPFGVVIQNEKEKPRLIVLHPTKRLLFYTDVGVTPQLIRTRLDGSHKIVITKASDISAIAVDSENDLVVWTQGHSIYISNIDGENQHVLFNESNSRITQLTIHTGWLYWVDRELSHLQRLELLSGKYGSPLSVQASHIVDIISVTKPDRNNSCSQLQQKKCSHLCILNGTNPVCACPKGYILKEDKKTCSTLLNCGPDRFTCALIPADEKDCIPLSWRCDKQDDCPNGSDELDCPDCQIDQFKCQDGQCINSIHVCDDIPHCSDKSDELNCCKDGFQCPNTQVCLPLDLVCDKTDNCADGSDEHPSLCLNANNLKQHTNNTMLMIILGVFGVFVGSGIVFYCLFKKCSNNDDINDQSEDSLSPMNPKPTIKSPKVRKGFPDVITMSMLNGSDISSYDRSHITGASSSTNGSSLINYPRETLNPPPSPATTAASTRGSTPSSRYRPYRHYRSINQPPPPTPCSTDVCDESDANYPTTTTTTTRCRYDGGPFPPPPTPRSHCDSCPPSPSSRSSTYFSPLPPPPSPVTSPPRGYDS